MSRARRMDWTCYGQLLLSQFYDFRIANSRVSQSGLSFWREMSGFERASWRGMSDEMRLGLIRYEHIQPGQQEIKMSKSRLFNVLVAMTLLVPIVMMGMGFAALSRTEAKGTFITPSTSLV